MDTTNSMSIDFDAIARQLRLQEHQVRATSELLDEGNTVPFITRYRKDRTGGLDEEKIRLVQEAVSRRRQLNERKDRILRSIQSQNRLTPEVQAAIEAAASLKTLDDLYLPFRPKKQTLATLARQRGLEPLASEILDATPENPVDLDARCQALVDPEKELKSAADVMAGTRHILAELISERADLRSTVRRVLSSGELVSKRIERNPDDDLDDLPVEEDFHRADELVDDEGTHESVETPTDTATATADAIASDSSEGTADTADVSVTPQEDQPPAEANAAATDAGTAATDAESGDTSSETSDEGIDATSEASTEASADSAPPEGENAATDAEAAAKAEKSKLEKAEKVASVLAAKRAAAEERRAQRREARHRKRQKLEQSFKDYFDYNEPLKKLPHYRVLAVNRGERCKVLRVKIQYDAATLKSDVEAVIKANEHPHAELLLDVAQDTTTRLVVPSIEREIRRELTERAESHAVKVFAQNLRKLLLQPPLRGRRVLAIDPGFRSGCKLVALDEFGNVLGHTLIHVIGAAERVQQSRTRLTEQIKSNGIQVVAIGNGTACRETEQMVASVLSDELAGHDVNYLIVNEAGASVYSTSQIGREELPRFDATVRGAVSIGRRALDPLSELVKIDPASIGVGLYQHDVKAKHLRTSLDAVVESCVNYVGVDVNSASPALLGYVSGLNQLTARRVYEYRQKNGPFRHRDQLKEVPGVGEATYVQAAGFLKIPGGDNALDETWIHPESYEIAQRVLQVIGCSPEQLASLLKARRAATAPPAPQVAKAETATNAPRSAFSAGLDLDADATETSEPADSAPSDESVAGPADGVVPEAATADSTTAADDAVAAEATDTVAEVVAGEATDAIAAETADVAPPADEAGVSDGAASTEVAPVEQAAGSGADATSDTGIQAIADKLAALDVETLAGELNVGTLLLKDILAALARPGRDPREDLSPPVFRREVLKLENLKPGMQLSGTVLNVVDFGAFVDIGLSDSGLIHVSRLADRFVSDPHEVVSVGDILNVWVVEVDEKRR
ncbi:MAG: helix-hairpin-helix domain-containing protein, partial [Planctomycetales bacterium]|nr:helix-hairpin-helix domain-containing protein [Planctomycetales bacterium]